MTQPEEVELEFLKMENSGLRNLLFNQHGSNVHYLYGDDGERQCNTCWIDFKRDSVDEIEQKLHNWGMKKLIEIQSKCEHTFDTVPEGTGRGSWHVCSKCFKYKDTEVQE